MKRLTKKQRKDYLIVHPLCTECGKIATQVHHIKMIIDNGSNEQTNLKALCFDCHNITDDHARCVGRLTFTMQEDGTVTMDE